MKKVLLGLALVGIPLAAWANCTYHTYLINGRVVPCTTCCYGNNCTTTCH